MYLVTLNQVHIKGEKNKVALCKRCNFQDCQQVEAECTQVSGLCRSPAVLHKVMHNFVQDLLKQGRADPQVLDGKRGQVG